ncbi:MAG: serine hydroxymethyltransferase [Clostridia bacterium]|nr:serine hydroxymethyltransferase [Clostridia bacterium]
MNYKLDNVQLHDPELYNLIRREEHRQETTLEMIASESIQSPQLLEINACAFNNKTVVGALGGQHIAGSEVADQLISLTAERACKLYGAEHANVQVYSGSTANYAVYAACLEIGDQVLAIRSDHGGHATHGSSDNIASKMYRFAFYSVTKDTNLIDYDELERMAHELRPKLIVGGGNTYSQCVDYARIASIAKSVGAYFMFDMAHYTGLVAAGLMPSPVPYADFVTGSTTKTICGPRSGFILCKKEYAEMIDRGACPQIVASLHLQTMAAMAHAFEYATRPEFKRLMQRTVDNAQALCRALQQRGFKIVTDGTLCHLMVIDMRNRNISGKEFVQVLEKIKLSVNPVPVPYDPSPVRNGIRIGCTVCAQRGMGSAQMEQIASIIDRVSRDPYNETLLAECAKEVQTITEQFPLYGQYDA